MPSWKLMLPFQKSSPKKTLQASTGRMARLRSPSLFTAWRVPQATAAKTRRIQSLAACCHPAARVRRAMPRVVRLLGTG